MSRAREFGRNFVSTGLTTLIPSEALVTFAQVSQLDWAKGLEQSFLLDIFGSHGVAPFLTAVGWSVALGLVTAGYHLLRPAPKRRP